MGCLRENRDQVRAVSPLEEVHFQIPSDQNSTIPRQPVAKDSTSNSGA